MAITNYTTNYTMYMLDDTWEYELEIEYDAYYDPGKVTGLPEDCYPSDSELSIKSITILSKRCLDEDVLEPTENEIQVSIADHTNMIENYCWDNFFNCKHDE